MRICFFLLLAPALWAQDALGLRDAVRLALRENKAIAASQSANQAADARLTQARSGKLPKINYSETFARSDNPVFVFSSLLTQHQFGVENLAIDTLNRPGFLNNFQSVLTVDQPLYDAGQTKTAVKGADIARQMSAEELRRSQMDVIAQTVRSYYGVLLAEETLKAAAQAVNSAEADLERAESVRAAGMATDADVLSIKVHLAAMREQRIDREASLSVAKAKLNDSLGMPLDTPHLLATALSEFSSASLELTGLESVATETRPEARQSKLAATLAEAQAEGARGAMLPQVGFRGAFEADRERFVTRGGVNWLASVQLRWNLFNGSADKAHIQETESLLARAKSEQQRAGSTIRLQVRQALAALQAAEQRIQVARAAVAQAEESLRITQNRYTAGMNNVTDLLRTETAVLDTCTRYLGAIHDQRIAALMLDYAAGRLTADSEVLN